MRTIYRQRRRGFTLVEVTLVIVIVLIVSSLAIGVYSPFRDRQAVASAMDKFAMALHKARSSAIFESQSFRVTLQQPEGVFWIDRTGNSRAEQTDFNVSTQVITDPITGNQVQIGLPKVVRPESLPDNVSVTEISANIPRNIVGSSTYFYFIFEPDGSAGETGGIEFIADSTDPAVATNFFSIRILGATGTIEKRPQQPLP